jgi:hypothetical protein
MMTEIERTIAHLQEESCKNTATFEHVHLNNVAIEALRKRMPMLVNHEKTFWTYKHFCPSCSGQLFAEGVAYCEYCGQNLNWSNYWEALK